MLAAHPMMPTTPPPTTAKGAGTDSTSVAPYTSMPIQMEVVGKGLVVQAEKVSWKTDATMRPTAEALRPGSARRYSCHCLRGSEEGGRQHGDEWRWVGGWEGCEEWHWR